uniref:Ig-like domain-containing protein n=1 Tax=Poecilia formosa TaxID=48698 RepID=A0A096M110_POEFO
MIYTDGKKSENCKKRSDSPKRCFYNFYKNISSSDAGTYYCAVATCGQILFGNGIKNGIQKQQHNSYQTTVSGPTEPTGSETLQCSVLSDSDITTCSGEPSVFWFRSRSEKSFPDMIYTDGKKSNNCDKISDSQKRCFYNFSKNIRSSDAGTYYCAVATCGQIIFGNGNSLETKGFRLGSKKAIIVIFFLSAALAISLIGIAVLLCSIKRNKCGHCQVFNCVEAVILDQNCGQKRQQGREDRRMYSAAVFTMMKSDNTATKKTAETQMMFAAVKAFG